MSITYSECVFVASGIQHATRMRCIVISGLQYSTIFSHVISQTVRFSEKDFIEYKIHVLIFSTKFCLQICPSKQNRSRYDQKCITVYMQSARYSYRIVMKLWRDFRETLIRYQISWKSVQWGTESVHADGRTDGRADRQTDIHDEATSSVPLFCEHA